MKRGPGCVGLEKGKAYYEAKKKETHCSKGHTSHNDIKDEGQALEKLPVEGRLK